jgi:hypothetical protein
VDASDNSDPQPSHLSLSTTVTTSSLSHSRVFSSKCPRRLKHLVDVYHLSRTIAVEVSLSACISASLPLLILVHSVATVNVNGEHWLTGESHGLNILSYRRDC